jgi:hypothetical protein
MNRELQITITYNIINKLKAKNSQDRIIIKIKITKSQIETITLNTIIMKVNIRKLIKNNLN